MGNLVVSYQMGKVASSTIVASIPDCEQFHSWSSEEPIKFFSSRNTGSTIGRIKQHFKWKMAFSRLLKKIERCKKSGGRIKLIIGVREPVSRNISGYFQSLMERERNTTSKECCDNFFAYCPHMMPLQWFDVELKQKLGIDVYSYPFDCETGCTSFSNAEFDVFIYQQEMLNNVVNELGVFLGLPDLELKTVNEGEAKWSSLLYQKVVRDIEFPNGYLEMMYESKYFNHFYGYSLKDKYMKKWSGV